MKTMVNTAIAMNAHDLAYMLTAYERIGSVNRDDLIELLADELTVTVDMISYYNDHCIEHKYFEDIVRPISDLESEIELMEPAEAFRLAYGSKEQFSWNDDYYCYDGYNNLRSYSETALLEKIADDDEFKREYVDAMISVDYDDDEIAAIIAECNALIRKGY